MAASILGRQLRRTFVTTSPISTFLHRYTTPQPPHFPSNPIPLPHHHLTFRPISYNSDSDSEDRRAYQNVPAQILYKVEQQKRREKEARQKAGLDTADLDAEDDEDYMGVGPLIEKLEKEMLKKGADIDLNRREEPSDSESDEDEDAYKDYDAIQRSEMLEEKLRDRYEVLFENFMLAGTADEGYKWMKKIDQFEEKYLQSRSEFRVICDLMNRLKVATGKEKFLLQHKLNRATRLIKYKDKYDPNNPANYGVIPNPEQSDPSADHLEDAEVQTEKQTIDEDGEEEFDDMKERDDILLEQLNAIDKKLEEKLADLDHTFGKKGKVLEEEIRDLAEERSFLTEKKRRPLFRKGFDVKLIDVNRTCKVTKGGQVIKYSAMLACGNYHGVIGFAKAKGPSVDIALQKEQLLNPNYPPPSLSLCANKI